MRDDLNRLVLAMAPAHVARPIAPSTLAELYQCGDTLAVWDGASEGTVYGCPKVNHAFRAWHDAAHIAGGFAFDLDGEIAACRYQIRQALERFPRLPGTLVRAVECEIVGQAEYFAAHGTFPANQLEFFNNYVRVA